VFLSHVSRLIIHGSMACVLIDGYIARDVCWNGQFTLSDIMISANGHVIINHAIAHQDIVQQEEKLTINAYMTLFWISF